MRRKGCDGAIGKHGQTPSRYRGSLAEGMQHWLGQATLTFGGLPGRTKLVGMTEMRVGSGSETNDASAAAEGEEGLACDAWQPWGQ